jgi:hypothetical protein
MSGCVTLTRPALSLESLGVVHGPVEEASGARCPVVVAGCRVSSGWAAFRALQAGTYARTPRRVMAREKVQGPLSSIVSVHL